MPFDNTFTLPNNTFPPLDLSKETQRAFALEAERIVYDTIDASELFFASEKPLPPAQWKRIRSKENYNVYRERNVQSGNPRRFSIMEPRFTTESTTQSVMTMDDNEDYTSNIDKPAHVPMLIGHGTIGGKLEDVMLGVFANDDVSWRFKSTYLEDGLDDAKILFHIRGPSESDPYRSLTVKWFIRECLPGSERFFSRRDYLVIEATGIALDSQGRQLSYCLVHSKRIPQIRELHDMNVIRGKLSLCFVSRQGSPTTVEMYCRGYSDACGNISVNLCAKLAADNILASVNAVECGYMKKLTWLVKQQDARQRTSSSTAKPTSCSECKRSISRFGAFLTGAPCRVCLQVRLASLCSCWLRLMLICVLYIQRLSARSAASRRSCH